MEKASTSSVGLMALHPEDLLLAN